VRTSQKSAWKIQFGGRQYPADEKVEEGVVVLVAAQQARRFFLDNSPERLQIVQQIEESALVPARHADHLAKGQLCEPGR
jgi:hypothetical protein